MMRDFEIYYNITRDCLFPLPTAGKIIGALRGHQMLLEAAEKLLEVKEPELKKKIDELIKAQKEAINEVIAPSGKGELPYVS